MDGAVARRLWQRLCRLWPDGRFCVDREHARPRQFENPLVNEGRFCPENWVSVGGLLVPCLCQLREA